MALRGFAAATVAAAALLMTVASSHASLMAYMSVRGQKQGDIKGGILQKGREGKIGVIACSHEIVSPRDAATGLPTGRRMHKPFVVTIEWDRALPQLYTALTNNENLSEVNIDFYTPQIRATTGVGMEGNDFSIKLTNASIASIRAQMPNIRVPETQRLEKTLEIAFTYQRIQWVNKESGGIFQDEWESRSVMRPSGGRRLASRGAPKGDATVVWPRRVPDSDRHVASDTRLARAR